MKPYLVHIIIFFSIVIFFLYIYFIIYYSLLDYLAIVFVICESRLLIVQEKVTPCLSYQRFKTKFASYMRRYGVSKSATY